MKLVAVVVYEVNTAIKDCLPVVHLHIAHMKTKRVHGRWEEDQHSRWCERLDKKSNQGADHDTEERDGERSSRIGRENDDIVVAGRRRRRRRAHAAIGVIADTYVLVGIGNDERRVAEGAASRIVIVTNEEWAGDRDNGLTSLAGNGGKVALEVVGEQRSRRVGEHVLRCDEEREAQNNDRGKHKLGGHHGGGGGRESEGRRGERETRGSNRQEKHQEGQGVGVINQTPA
jgi:hypothetical protein